MSKEDNLQYLHHHLGLQLPNNEKLPHISTGVDLPKNIAGSTKVFEGKGWQ